MVIHWQHPKETDYPPYYGKYIQKVPEGDLIEFLTKSTRDFVAFMEKLPEDKLRYRYEENKWTIPQIVQHLIDGERVFSYRAMRFARNDKTELPGFEENDFANEATGEGRTFKEILDEFTAVRASTIFLLKSFTDELLDRSGSANNSMISVRSICFIIAGHGEHHLNIIKERYLQIQESQKQ